MRIRTEWVLLSVCASATAAMGQSIRTDMGWTALKNELGNSMPTGVGVPVTIVESAHVPDPAAFTGKTITSRTPGAPISSSSPGADGSHANTVGGYFFGGTGWSNSFAAGVTTVDAYTSVWDSTGFLYQSGSYAPPQRSPNRSRVANHSYQYLSYDSFTGDRLRRLDWVIETDDFIQVTGNTGSGTILPLGSGYNTIAVGPVNNGPYGGTPTFPATSTFIPNPPTDTAYAAGRIKPDLVGPTSVSNAAGMVSGMVASLIEVGHGNPALSKNRSYTPSRYANDAQPPVVYQGETSETIKAVLMAGAKRSWVNTNPFEGSTVSNYREGNVTVNSVSVPTATNNGLDRRYGAGQANLYNSYHILAGGQQDSLEDAPTTIGQIAEWGWDYDDAFGGANGSNATATYQFIAGTTPGKLVASLVWNVDINGGTDAEFSGAATIRDLNLKLYDITAAGALVGNSASTIDNTENLWTDLVAGHLYKLEVSKIGGDFSWDYAVAWHVETGTVAIPEPSTMLLLSASMVLLGRRVR